VIDSLGVLGPGTTLDPEVVDGPIAGGEGSFWVFSLSDDVVLNLSVVANDQVGDPDVWIYSTTGAYYPLETVGDEIHALELPAGDYKLEVRAQPRNALDAGLTLTLSAVAP
jgi:hypothetical protein